jgi:hypothetical protein
MLFLDISIHLRNKDQKDALFWPYNQIYHDARSVEYQIFPFSQGLTVRGNVKTTLETATQNTQFSSFP